MLAWLYANVSFTVFILQSVTDQLDEPFGSSRSQPFSAFNIVFTLFSRQIKYDDDDDDDEMTLLGNCDL